MKEDPVSVQLQLQSDSFPFQERLLEGCTGEDETCDDPDGVQECCEGLYCKNRLLGDQCKEAGVCKNDSNDPDSIVKYFEYYNGCWPNSKKDGYRDHCHEGVVVQYTFLDNGQDTKPENYDNIKCNGDREVKALYYDQYSAYDNGDRRESCQCQDVQSHNGKPMYYVEQRTSDDSGKHGSLCVQCRGGTFFGKRKPEVCRCNNVSSRTCLKDHEGTCYSWKCEQQLTLCWFEKVGPTYFPDVQEIPDDGNRGCHVCVETAEGWFDFDYVCSDTNYNLLAMVPSSPEGTDGDWSDMCQPCPKGTYSEQGDEYCKPCEPGYYTDVEESTSCKICPEGESRM